MGEIKISRVKIRRVKMREKIRRVEMVEILDVLVGIAATTTPVQEAILSLSFKRASGKQACVILHWSYNPKLRTCRKKDSGQSWRSACAYAARKGYEYAEPLAPQTCQGEQIS